MEGVDALVRSGWLERELPQWRVRLPAAPRQASGVGAGGGGGAAILGDFDEGGKAEAYVLGVETALSHAMQTGGDDAAAVKTLRMQPAVAADGSAHTTARLTYRLTRRQCHRASAICLSWWPEVSSAA